RRGGGRVRRLPGGPWIRDHYDPKQHEHGRCLRGAGLDFDPRVDAVCRGWRPFARAGTLGGSFGRVTSSWRSPMNRLGFTAAAGIAALCGLAGAACAQTSEKFTFALNWFAVGDHAAYWVALDKGYFAQQGLEVTLENSKGSGDSIAKVDSGRADAGLADTAVVIASLPRTAKIKIVGLVVGKTPVNVFSAKAKPVLNRK